MNIPTVVPLFPLPGIVLFPRMIVPLHVFEPRYRAMVANAVLGDHTIALALLRPGWEPLYHTLRAPICRTIGVGRILQHEQTDDGNYNLLLCGIGRAVVVEELTALEQITHRAYRQARIEPIETFCSGAEADQDGLRREILSAVETNAGLPAELREAWLRLRDDDEPAFADFVDMLAAGLPGDAELRQCLLEEPDDMARAAVILAHLRTLAAMAAAHQRSASPNPAGLN